MPRFFIPPDQIHGNRFVLSGTEAHHALTVLRKKIGDTIDLFDGKDLSYEALIELIGPDRIEGTLTVTPAGRRVSIHTTLYQALIKGPKWDWLLEKACEIGVGRVVPVVTARSVVKISASGAGEKMTRWRRIALEASKQCGRAEVMEVVGPVVFATAVSHLLPETLSLIPWEKEAERSIRRACHDFHGTEVSIFIGPEGGWEAQEVDLAQRRGVIPVRLGPTLLRSETAGLVAAALVLGELGIYS